VRNKKVYKELRTSYSNMLPGDLQGSPDESFFQKNNLMNTLVFIDEAFLSKLPKYFGGGITEKDFPENESELWEDKTKINGVWVDDKTGDVL